jgi:ferredoxin
MGDELYSELAARINMTDSKRIPLLWKMICNDTEAKLVLETPGTAEQLSEKMSMPVSKLRAMLEVLFQKGVIFETIKNDVVTYRMPRHFLQFHDATILWKGAPPGFLELWQEYMDVEYPSLTKMLYEAAFPAFMRVIPVNASVEGKSQVLPYESVAKMIADAKAIAVTPCTCRKTAKRCNHPLEACLQLNRGAEYSIKRGTGRKISREEAMKIIDECEKAGLVHMGENKAGLGTVICNCCDCCCEMLVPVIKSGHKSLLSPSRYRAVVDMKACNLCGVCADRCKFEAFVLSGQDKDQKLEFREEHCVGCGLCMVECAPVAITLTEIRPPEFIPA